MRGDLVLLSTRSMNEYAARVAYHIETFPEFHAGNPTSDFVGELSTVKFADGEMEVEGLVPWSSNYTCLVTVEDADLKAMAIYKPCYGERPLLDFDEGTLCRREVAAYLLSQLLGWPDIPPVILRDGPHGPGSVQLFIDADLEEHYFTLRGQPEHDRAFRRVALFDYVANNADRKGGHVLRGTDGTVWSRIHTA